jgi:inactivated superfamily I helicase
LKGATNFEEDEPIEVNDDSNDAMDYEQSQEFEDDGFLDEEHPPETFSSHQDEMIEEVAQSPAKKASILSQLNKRSLPRTNSERSPVGTMDLKGMATALTENQERRMDQLIQYHRRFVNEMAKDKLDHSNLLASMVASMKAQDDQAQVFQDYCREVDEKLKERMAELVEFQSKLGEYLE